VMPQTQATRKLIVLLGLLACTQSLPPPPATNANAPTSTVPNSGAHASVPGCRGIGLRGLDVTVPFDPTVGERIAIFYSFVPWILALVWLVMTLVFRSTQLLLGVFWSSVVVVLNELVWKRVLAQSRPAGSCLHSKGMPSTHSELAFGMFVWLGLELLFHRQHWPMDRRIGSVLGLAVLLLPVLPSRQVLHDHSAAQVLVGALIGAVFGASYFLVLHYYGAPWLNSLQLPALSVAAEREHASAGHMDAGTMKDSGDDAHSVAESSSSRVSCVWIYDDYSQNTPARLGVLRKSHSDSDLRHRRKV
jgi:acid phosphatase family membrane protein YuiD